jgi:four helix bundle protein
MLRIYTDILAVIPQLVPVLDAIEQKDPDLARQGRRALTSMPLNTAEGSYSRGRNRGARYHTAAGSARELIAVIETSVAFGHIKPLDARLMDTLFKILATLFKNT